MTEVFEGALPVIGDFITVRGGEAMTGRLWQMINDNPRSSILADQNETHDS